MATISEIASKYGATVIPATPTTPDSYQAIADKYGATYTPLQPLEVKPYSFTEAITHPFEAIKSAGNAAINTIQQTFSALGENLSKTFSSQPETAAERTANIVKSIGSVATTLLTPINAAFSAAEQLPVLKEAADIISIPFQVTGKIGTFASDKFVDVLPISQESKDILRPAFEELGSLTGQILLGGKVMHMISNGLKIDKASVESVKNDVKVIADKAKTELTDTTVQPTKAPEIGQISPKIALKPLAQEATKLRPQDFKSAEEFVKAQKPIYRGGKEFVYDPKLDTGNTPFTTEKSIAQDFAKKSGGVVNERYIGPQSKVLDASKIDMADFVKEGYKNLTHDNIIEYADLKGYDVVDFTANKKGIGAMQEMQVINPDKLLTKSQLTKIWEKANQVTKGEVPTAEGLAPSGIAKSIEQKAVDTGVTKGFETLASYEPITWKEQFKQAADTLNSDFNGTREIIRGEKSLPEKLNGVFLLAKMEEYIKNNPDANKNGELSFELANSPLVAETSKAAQTLGATAIREPDSATFKYQELKKYREQKVGEEIIKKKSEIVKKSKTSDFLTKEEKNWNKFLDEIVC